MSIRLAIPDDAARIREIYAPYITEGVASFEYDVPDIAEMQHRLANVQMQHAWLVHQSGDALTGYAYASQHRARTAYQWSVDVTVYIHANYHRRGIGRMLYACLFKILVLQGYYNAYAGITLPNAGSVGLHESMGFVPIGVYHHIGYKFGQWHDVGWWEYALQPMTSAPGVPYAIHAPQITVQVQRILQSFT